MNNLTSLILDAATMRAGLLADIEQALNHEEEQDRLWLAHDSAAGTVASLERTEPIFLGC